MVTAGPAESNGSLPPGLWLTSPAGWLPITWISSWTLRSVIEYGLPLPLSLSGQICSFSFTWLTMLWLFNSVQRCGSMASVIGVLYADLARLGVVCQSITDRGQTDCFTVLANTDHDLNPWSMTLNIDSCGRDSYACKKSRSKVRNKRTDGHDQLHYLVWCPLTRSTMNTKTVIHPSTNRALPALVSSSNTHTHTRLTALCLGLFGWAGTRKFHKTNLDFTEARDSEWQWHPLGHMQVCTSL